MKRVSDLTVGEMGKGVGRYWPYLGTVLAVLLVVTLLPPKGTPGGSSQDASDTGVTAGDGQFAASTGTADSGDPGFDASSAGVQAGSGAQARGGSARVSPASGATSVNAGKWPGVGTPEALAAPDCDAKTGRLMIPTVYAPPCVAIWPKGANNGGATTKGVTDKEIVVVLRSPPPDPQTDAIGAAFDYGSKSEVEKELTQNLINMWQAHAETYGRKVKFHHLVGSGTSAEAQRADAIKVSQELKPFMVYAPSASHAVFAQEMASRGTFAFNWAVFPQDNYTKKAPYLWTSDGAGAEEDILAVAEYLGKRLWGRPAKWAGDPLMQQQPRKFGVVYPDTPEGRAGLAVFQAEVAKYRVKIAVTVGQTGAAEQTQVIISKMKDAGVSVVLPLASAAIPPVALQAEATKQNYFPEWFGYGVFFRVTGRAQDPGQSDQSYGITSNFVPVPIDYWEPQRLYRWEYGPDAEANPDGVRGTWRHFFMQTAMLFDGIQLAGPNLTPQRFRDALFSLPPSGGAPSGAVTTKALGFGNHGTFPFTDYAGSDDYSEAWWSSTAAEQNGASDGVGIGQSQSAPGVYMFLNGGKRFRPNQMPTTEPDMFNEASATISLPKPPEREMLNYPNLKVRGK